MPIFILSLHDFICMLELVCALCFDCEGVKKLKISKQDLHLCHLLDSTVRFTRSDSKRVADNANKFAKCGMLGILGSESLN